MMCASFGRAPQPPPSRRASASVSMPSGCSSTACSARPALAQREQRAVVGGALDDHVVAGPHEVLEQERVGLHRAVGDEHALGLDAVAVGDPRAQARVADGGAVGGRARGVALEGAHGGVAQALDVDDVERRRAAREGDRGAGGASAQPGSLGARAARRSRGSARAPCARAARGSAAAPRRPACRAPRRRASARPAPRRSRARRLPPAGWRAERRAQAGPWRAARRRRRPARPARHRSRPAARRAPAAPARSARLPRWRGRPRARFRRSRRRCVLAARPTARSHRAPRALRRRRSRSDRTRAQRRRRRSRSAARSSSLQLALELIQCACQRLVHERQA